MNPLIAIIDEARLLYRLHSAPDDEPWETCEHCQLPWPCARAREAIVAIATHCLRTGEPFELRCIRAEPPSSDQPTRESRQGGRPVDHRLTHQDRPGRADAISIPVLIFRPVLAHCPNGPSVTDRIRATEPIPRRED
jgi:hypothetical protein